MTEWNFPSTWTGNGRYPISSGLGAAFRICTIDQEPRFMVAIWPVPSSCFDSSHSVVVGSGSVSPRCTASKSSESMTCSSLPGVRGASVVASSFTASGLFEIPPRWPAHWAPSGHPSA
jgi:hypothetical protein